MKQKAKSVTFALALSIVMVVGGGAAAYGYLEVWNIAQVSSKSELWDAIYHKALLIYFMALVGGVTLGFTVPIYFRMFRQKRKNPAEPGSGGNR